MWFIRKPLFENSHVILSYAKLRHIYLKRKAMAQMKRQADDFYVRMWFIVVVTLLLNLTAILRILIPFRMYLTLWIICAAIAVVQLLAWCHPKLRPLVFNPKATLAMVIMTSCWWAFMAVIGFIFLDQE